MRALTILGALALSVPALAAGIPDMPRWSVDVHETHPDTNVGAVVTAEPLGKGWRLVLVCETTDTIKKRVIARRRYEGLGVRQEAMKLVIGVMERGKGRITLSFDGDDPILLTSYEGCPSGPGRLSTGD